MKKILLLAVTYLAIAQTNAQISLPKTADVTKAATSALGSFIAPPKLGDLTGTTKSVVDKLSSQLSLPAAQKGPLSDAVGGFLKQKQGIMGLAGSDPTAYLSKFAPMQQGLFGKMKGILGADTFSKFLKLKPSGSGAGNVLSNLFF
jgi:hypothetical protein